MLTAILHFVIGFTVALSMTFVYARLSGESNSTGIPFGIISGVICATLATFMSPWLTPLALLALVAASHHEYTANQKYAATQEHHADFAESSGETANEGSDRD